MALWSNTDEAASAPKYTVDVVTGNTGIQAFQQTPVGTFGVDAAETSTTPGVTHGGWVLRTEGSGGRAGRVFQETLVAMGSMGEDDSIDDDDAQYVDAIITLGAGTNATANAGDNVSFTFTAAVTPSYAPLSYQWYDAVADDEISGATGATLTVNNVQSNNTYYVIVTSGDVSVQSANVTLTINE